MPPFFIKMTKLNIASFIIIVIISFSLIYLSRVKQEDSSIQSEIKETVENFSKDSENQFKRTEDYLQLRIKRRPSDFTNYNELAETYLTKARETGDLNYYIKAENLLNKSFQLNPESYIANLYLGLIKQAKHEFQSSINYVRKSVELKPEESYAYGVLGDAYLELGNLSKAKKMYEKMHSMKPSLESYGRLSNLELEKGNFDAALVEMQNAYDVGVKNSNSKENLAWTQSMIGSIYFDSGNDKESEKHYKKSLKIMENYYLALQKLAELNEKRKNYEEAEKLYLKVLELNSRPEVHHALSHLYTKMDRDLLAETHEVKAKKMAEEYEKLGFNELHTHSHSH